MPLFGLFPEPRCRKTGIFAGVNAAKVALSLSRMPLSRPLDRLAVRFLQLPRPSIIPRGMASRSTWPFWYRSPLWSMFFGVAQARLESEIRPGTFGVAAQSSWMEATQHTSLRSGSRKQSAPTWPRTPRSRNGFWNIAPLPRLLRITTALCVTPVATMGAPWSRAGD